MKKILVGVLSLLITGCATTPSKQFASDFSLMSETVTAVVFMQREGSNSQVVTTVTGALRVNRIVKGIEVQKEIPVSNHVFRDHAVFLKGTNKCMHISFKYEPWSDRYLLRYRDRQYETPKATYELLARYRSLRKVSSIQ